MKDWNIRKRLNGNEGETAFEHARVFDASTIRKKAIVNFYDCFFAHLCI